MSVIYSYGSDLLVWAIRHWRLPCLIRTRVRRHIVALPNASKNAGPTRKVAIVRCGPHAGILDRSERITGSCREQRRQAFTNVTRRTS